MGYKNIYKINGKYHIIKSIYKQKINYGIYDNLDDAIKQRTILILNQWIKSEESGYAKSEQFPIYEIYEHENGYYLKNNENNKSFGSFKDLTYTKIIQKILPYYQEVPDIKTIKKQAINEFYRHITYNRTTKRYQISYNEHIYATSTDIIETLQERDMIIKYDADEDMMCEYNPPNKYDKDKIPKYRRRIENIIQINSLKNKFLIQKQINKKKITIGRYMTYELAEFIRNYLDDNNWSCEAIRHIKKITKIIQNRDLNIHTRNSKFYVELRKDDELIIFAYYDDIEMARYIRKLLSENNWNSQKIHEYEESFNKNFKKTKYFYDKTDFIKS
ncbi:MAG: hypothetical protein SOZ23_03400 [Methanosphaera sp.]|uniref:hypothetical protein n=1 Tax=Methanosphaera sp. TaxID=2666342 RepID=UPI0025D2D5B7|nr:hypothetical protein [Methanosphaera sp.]MCI5867424.1 hypothetical protein [Methanosphaera sp.]MDD6534508.1 hypothetical protein [Methanosphaera sp.]MDY3955823.1 hypothetical protein [Methanosphaera sp.]